MRRLAAAVIAALLLVGCETRNSEDDDDGWCAGNTFNTARATACVAQRLDEQNQLLAELIDVLEDQP